MLLNTIKKIFGLKPHFRSKPHRNAFTANKNIKGEISQDVPGKRVMMHPNKYWVNPESFYDSSFF